MRPIGASAITVAGVALLWFVATRPLVTDAAPMPGPAPLSTDLDAPVIAGVIHPARAGERTQRRDLFGYVDPPPVAAVVPAAPPVETVPPQVIVEAQPVEDPPPQFEYRYIGRFGRERDPIIAFAADGDVVTIRRGDRIGEGFVLQSIGLDSVELVDTRGRVIRRRLGE